MCNLLVSAKYFLSSILLITSLTSCLNTWKVAYFYDAKDSTLIASEGGLEPIIQKKDFLSIPVSSLGCGATVIFNTSNLSVTPAVATSITPKTAGYLVSDAGTVKFPISGDIPAAGLTQKQLEDILTKMLIGKKLLFDPIVTACFLNFRVTVPGEVKRHGVAYVSREQISILKAAGGHSV